MPRLTTKGQVTIPKKTRDALGIGPGTEVEFIVRGTEAVIRKASIRDAIERWAGYLADAGETKSADEMLEELRGPAPQ
jgi:AbrB family looped-hinge helix DNA binding protein